MAVCSLQCYYYRDAQPTIPRDRTICFVRSEHGEAMDVSD